MDPTRQRRPPHSLDEPAGPSFGPPPWAEAEQSPAFGADRPRGRRARGGLGAAGAALTCCALLAGAAWILVAELQPRRAAESRLQEALRANAALQAQLDAQLAPGPAGPAAPQAASLDAAEGLMEALTEALDRPISLGQLALHPNEGRVEVRLAHDVADPKELSAVLGGLAQIVGRQPGAWEVRVWVGRPRGPGRGGVGGWALVGALAHMLDETLGAQPLPWALGVGDGPPGAVRLMLQPVAGDLSPQSAQ